MKLLVVSLALTVFAGSQAFVLRDEPNSKVAELQKELREYNENSAYAFFTKIYLISKSGIGKELIAWPFETQEKINQRLNALQAKLPAEAIEVNHRVSSALRDLKQKVVNDLHTIHNKVAPEREAFDQALKSDLDPVLGKLDHYIGPFRHNLVKTWRELDAKLDEMLKQQVENMAAQSETFQIWVEKVKEFLDSITDQVQEQITREVEKAHDVLQRSAAHVLEVLNKHRESFDQWVHSPLFS